MRGKHVLTAALYCTTLLPAMLPAQTIYRCGNSYSQTPCPGGTSIEASDSRDKTQKAQAEATVRRDLKAAEALEKSRARQETAQARAARQHNMAVGDDLPWQDATTDQSYEGKRKKSEFFTAKTLDNPKKPADMGPGKPTKKPTTDSRP